MLSQETMHETDGDDVLDQIRSLSRELELACLPLSESGNTHEF